LAESYSGMSLKEMKSDGLGGEGLGGGGLGEDGFAEMAAAMGETIQLSFPSRATFRFRLFNGLAAPD
jgi:hypothetical protein